MVENYEYISIKEVMSRLTRFSYLNNITLEQVIQLVSDFIGKMGLPGIYVDKIVTLEVEDYRALLPCDLIQVLQVKDLSDKTCIRYNTDSFMNDTKGASDRSDRAYKLQGRIIYTTFEKGKIEVAYKSVKTDDEGLPMVPGTPKFLIAFEWYVRVYFLTARLETAADAFTYKTSAAALQNAQQEYAFAAGQCNNSFIIPSVDEMQSITGIWNQLLVRYDEHRTGFTHSGATEYIKNH